MIVRQSAEEQAEGGGDIVQLLKVENAALKAELARAKAHSKDVEYDNAQLRHKSTQINQLYERIESLTGAESEVTTHLKRQAELEL